MPGESKDTESRKQRASPKVAQPTEAEKQEGRIRQLEIGLYSSQLEAIRLHERLREVGELVGPRPATTAFSGARASVPASGMPQRRLNSADPLKYIPSSLEESKIEHNGKDMEPGRVELTSGLGLGTRLILHRINKFMEMLKAEGPELNWVEIMKAICLLSGSKAAMLFHMDPDTDRLTRIAVGEATSKTSRGRCSVCTFANKENCGTILAFSRCMLHPTNITESAKSEVEDGKNDIDDIELSFAVGEGMVGLCAKTGRIENTMDIRRDGRFVKERSWCKHREVLCVPISASDGTPTVVIVLTGKAKKVGVNCGAYSPEEETLAVICAKALSYTLKRCQLSTRLKLTLEKTTGFFESVKKLFTSDELTQAADNIVKKTRLLFNADYSLLFRLDKQTKELVIVSQNSELSLFIPQGYAETKGYKGPTSQRVPLETKSLATRCAKNIEQINITNSQSDPRFKKNADEYLAEGKYQLKTQGTDCVLVTPVMDTTTHKDVLGVHILGRISKKPFTKTDQAGLGDYMELMAICVNRIKMMDMKTEQMDKNLDSLNLLIDSIPEERILPKMKILMDEVDKLQFSNANNKKLLQFMETSRPESFG